MKGRLWAHPCFFKLRIYESICKYHIIPECFHFLQLGIKESPCSLQALSSKAWWRFGFREAGKLLNVTAYTAHNSLSVWLTVTVKLYFQPKQTLIIALRLAWRLKCNLALQAKLLCKFLKKTNVSSCLHQKSLFYPLIWFCFEQQTLLS